jgi:hypothetical protein
MNASLRLPFDKLVFSAAGAIVLGSLVWAWLQQAKIEQLRSTPAAVALSGGDYERQKFPSPSRAPKTWTKPATQSQGGGWIYEVFTPPVIYYHASLRAFSVTAPSGLADTNMPFGWELLDVKRELFRLQLMGYLGSPRDYLAAFVSPQLAETLLARPGRRFDELGLALKNFEVRKVNIAAPDQMPVYDIAAFAVVQDEQTGEEVTLDSRTRRFTDTPLAVLRLGPKAKPRELRQGDTFQDEAATYRVERIQLDPPEVVVARQTPGLPYPELRVLKPASAVADAKTSPESRLAREPRRGMAENAPRR